MVEFIYLKKLKLTIRLSRRADIELNIEFPRLDINYLTK